MHELVTATDSTGKPIFQPTQMHIEQPSKQKKTLSFSPSRGTKRGAEHSRLDFSPATKKEKQKNSNIL